MFGQQAFVIEPPGFNDPPCHRQAMVHVLVEALVTEAPVEALDESVPDRLSGRDVVPSDAPLLLPGTMVCEVSSVPSSLTIISSFLWAATLASRSAHGVSTRARSTVMLSERVSGLVTIADYRTAPRLSISSNQTWVKRTQDRWLTILVNDTYCCPSVSCNNSIIVVSKIVQVTTIDACIKRKHLYISI